MTKNTKVPSTTFTITIPDGDEPVQTGLLTVQRENLGVLHRFQFSTIDDLLDAMHAAAMKLAETTHLPDFAAAKQSGECTLEEGDQPDETHPPLIIMLTTTGQGALIRQAMVTARRGELGSIHRFQFSTMADIGAALQKVTGDLVAVEGHPPLYFPDLSLNQDADTEQVTVALYGPDEAASSTSNPIPGGDIACTTELPVLDQSTPDQGDNPQLSMF